MLSPCDSDQHVADGQVGPYVARGPVGPCGTLPPCDFETAGLVGLYAADGPVDPYVPVGPVGLCGTLSPFAPKSAILVDPGGMFPSYDIAVMGDQTVPAESASLRGPVGPTMTLGTLPLSDEIGGESMTIHGGWSGPDVAGTPAVVAAMSLRARFTETNVTLDCADECEAWDSGYQREIIDGVTVYYGGDLCDSEESDWEDPDDVARREYVDQYNFDLLEGMEPMVFVPGGNPSGSDRRDEDGAYLYDGEDARVSDDESIADRERNTWRKYCASVSFGCGCAATEGCA